MENTGLISQGMTLLLLGMGTVFVFLTLLVFVTTLMSSLIRKYLPQPEPAPVSAGPAAVPAMKDGRLIAIISAAIHQHRADRK